MTFNHMIAAQWPGSNDEKICNPQWRLMSEQTEILTVEILLA